MKYLVSSDDSSTSEDSEDDVNIVKIDNKAERGRKKKSFDTDGYIKRKTKKYIKTKSMLKKNGSPKHKKDRKKIKKKLVASSSEDEGSSDRCHDLKKMTNKLEKTLKKSREFNKRLKKKAKKKQAEEEEAVFSSEEILEEKKKKPKKSMKKKDVMQE